MKLCEVEADENEQDLELESESEELGSDWQYVSDSRDQGGLLSDFD